MSDSHKRRWYQFSLKTLLVVMLLSTVVVVGWIGIRLRRAQENRDRVALVEDAVAAIEKLGGDVTKAYEERRPRTWLEKQFDDPGDADDPVGVLTVSKVTLWHTTATDAALEHLKGMTSLQYLFLDEGDVTDAGLTHLV